MRVTNISSYAVSQPKSQVSFGLVENEENTRRVLPKNSGYRLKFADQFEDLKKHDAVTVTSQGHKAWAFINKGFEKMYFLLSDENFEKPNFLIDLEEQEQFDDFYRRLNFLDNKRQEAGSPSVKSTSSEEEWTSFDEALWRR